MLKKIFVVIFLCTLNAYSMIKKTEDSDCSLNLISIFKKIDNDGSITYSCTYKETNLHCPPGQNREIHRITCTDRDENISGTTQTDSLPIVTLDSQTASECYFEMERIWFEEDVTHWIEYSSGYFTNIPRIDLTGTDAQNKYDLMKISWTKQNLEKLWQEKESEIEN